MIDLIINIVLFIACYIIGSLSPSIFAAKLKGKDITKEGSGNAGTTNAFRILGKKMAIIVFLLDFIKGFLPTLLISLLYSAQTSYYCAVFLVIGHIFSCFHKFKAGKGVAVSIGAIFAIDWRIGAICLGLGIILILITRRVSVGSLSAALVLPIAVFFLCSSFFVLSLFISFLLFFTHRQNIVRLFKGNEKPLW